MYSNKETATIKTLPAVGPGTCSPSVKRSRDKKKKRKTKK
jgi:hypothetical protein